MSVDRNAQVFLLLEVVSWVTNTVSNIARALVRMRHAVEREGRFSLNPTMAAQLPGLLEKIAKFDAPLQFNAPISKL